MCFSGIFGACSGASSPARRFSPSQSCRCLHGGRSAIGRRRCGSPAARPMCDRLPSGSVQPDDDELLAIETLQFHPDPARSPGTHGRSAWIEMAPSGSSLQAWRGSEALSSATCSRQRRPPSFFSADVRFATQLQGRESQIARTCTTGLVEGAVCRWLWGERTAVGSGMWVLVTTMRQATRVRAGACVSTARLRGGVTWFATSDAVASSSLSCDRRVA